MTKISVSKHQYTNSIKIPSVEPTPPPIPVEAPKVEESVTPTPSSMVTEQKQESTKTSQANTEQKVTPNKSINDNSKVERSEDSAFPSVTLDFSNIVPEEPSFPNDIPQAGVSVPKISTGVPKKEHEYNGITGLHRDYHGGSNDEPRPIQIDTSNGENRTYVNGTTVPNNGIHITVKGDNNTININSSNPTETKDNLPSEKDILEVSSLEELDSLTNRLDEINRLVKAKRTLLKAERKYL